MAEQEAQGQGAEAQGIEFDDFASLIDQEFRPKSPEVKNNVEAAVATLAQQALADTALVSEDAVASINSMIAEIDKKLTDQVNEIMHHEEFTKCEGAWRGLHHLVLSLIHI